MIEPGDILPVHPPWPLSPNERPVPRRRPREQDEEADEGKTATKKPPPEKDVTEDDSDGHIDAYA